MQYVNIVEDFENRLATQIAERLEHGEDYEKIAKNLQFNASSMHTVFQALLEKDYLTPFQLALKETLENRLERGEPMDNICQSVQVPVDTLRETHELLRRRQMAPAVSSSVVEEQPFYTANVTVAKNPHLNESLFNKRSSSSGKGGEFYRNYFEKQMQELEAKDVG